MDDFEDLRRAVSARKGNNSLKRVVEAEYEDEPSLTLKRANGSTIRLYRSKTDPHAYLPVQDDGTVVDWMKRFTSDDQMLDEMAGGGLSRIAKHMNEPFAMISAFQPNTSTAGNLKTTGDLMQDLIRMRIGGIRMKGNYGTPEISFFVPAPKGMPFYQFLTLMTALADKYNQHSVAISDGKSVSLWFTSGGHEKIGDVATMRPAAVQDMWSQIKNKRFAIVPKGTIHVDGEEKPNHFDHTRLK